MEQSKPRFLVVEDEPSSAAVLQAVLNSLGRSVVAGDAAEAMHALQDFTPDTILLDISLPDMDGHALLGRIRQLPGLHDVPVIFVTAKNTPTDQIRGLDQGAIDYIVKPVEPMVLQARMRQHLQRLSEERRIRRLADYDDLTGLHNRRRFLEVLAVELERARRYHRSLSLLSFDLDHFKSVNDTYGHDAGDDVLAAVGKVLRERLRNADLSGRLGGEEFAVLLPETDEKGAHCVAEKLRKDIADLAIATSAGPVRPTASFGLSSWRDGDDIDSLRKRADEALYAAKDAGRNQVCIG